MSTKEVLQRVWKSSELLYRILFLRESETLINIWITKEQGHLVFVWQTPQMICEEMNEEMK